MRDDFEQLATNPLGIAPKLDIRLRKRRFGASEKPVAAVDQRGKRRRAENHGVLAEQQHDLARLDPFQLVQQHLVFVRPQLLRRAAGLLRHVNLHVPVIMHACVAAMIGERARRVVEEKADDEHEEPEGERLKTA
ncbi:hypothetical protein [Caballeronia grimmiae]|uniref:hypothetical protein n=1 Tax=Caballeronia grimmiae TaxID=1071679 RepID=UPI0038BDD3E1